MTGTLDPNGVAGGPILNTEGFTGSWQTYAEALTDAGVSWKVYSTGGGGIVLGNFVNFKNAQPGSGSSTIAVVPGRQSVLPGPAPGPPPAHPLRCAPASERTPAKERMPAEGEGWPWPPAGCLVVVRSLSDRATLVEAFDPGVMMRLAGGHGDLEGLASEVGQQLRAALAAGPGGREPEPATR